MATTYVDAQTNRVMWRGVFLLDPTTLQPVTYPLQVLITKQDLANVDSTTAALAGSATYTATAFGLDGYQKIVGSVFADQAGTLYVEQSQDGTNWDVISAFAVAANVGQGFQVDIVAFYGRVRYVNGATAQTIFRLYTNLRVI